LAISCIRSVLTAIVVGVSVIRSPFSSTWFSIQVNTSAIESSDSGAVKSLPRVVLNTALPSGAVGLLSISAMPDRATNVPIARPIRSGVRRSSSFRSSLMIRCRVSWYTPP
jgi:hypothetical protein